MKNFIKDQAKSVHEFRASNSTLQTYQKKQDFEPYGTKNIATGYGSITERSVEQLERNQQKVLETLKNTNPQALPSSKKLQPFKIKSNSQFNHNLQISNHYQQSQMFQLPSESIHKALPQIRSQNNSHESSQVYTPVNM